MTDNVTKRQAASEVIKVWDSIYWLTIVNILVIIFVVGAGYINFTVGAFITFGGVIFNAVFLRKAILRKRYFTETYFKNG